MLQRVNPYTKVRWADEPALAMVEINNENSLLQMALKGDLQELPERYVAPLRARWNAWLLAKYGTTDKLRAAWGAVANQPGDELLRNGDFRDGPAGWAIQSSDLTSVAASVDGPGGAPCLTVTFGSPGKLAWSHQVHQMGLTLEPGKVYTATYALRSDKPAVIATSARLDHAHPETGRYEMLGPDDKVAVGPTWQTYTYTFLATRYAGEGCRFGFTFPNAKGTYQLAQMSLHLGGAVGLEQGESLEAGSVACPLGGAQLVGTRRDFAEFLIAVERDYTQGMYRFLKDDLGVKCPVIDTQASYGGPGGLLREAGLDYVDMHAYWQHPKYLPKPGGGQTFELDNSPMVASDGGILVRLAEHRLRGRAFTVSEFNHAAPSHYQAEAWPMMASFAARQDWDGSSSTTTSTTARTVGSRDRP
ncbi:MAG: carbohydrate binding domain-containing protein [Gammaproteobacteria bacterium]|nr:carbohydrate binding domain-containing protein [Gammaproteobacteria bacterium]